MVSISFLSWCALFSLNCRRIALLPGPRPHGKLVLRRGLDQSQVVETLRPLRRLQALERRDHARHGDDLALRPPAVASERGAKRRPEVTPDDAEPGRLRRRDVFRPVYLRGVRVVDDERLLCSQTRAHENELPISRLQHVAAHPHVRIEEPLLVEGGLARSLDADEEDRFHPLRTVADRWRSAFVPDILASWPLRRKAAPRGSPRAPADFASYGFPQPPAPRVAARRPLARLSARVARHFADRLEVTRRIVCLSVECHGNRTSPGQHISIHSSRVRSCFSAPVARFGRNSVM